MRAVKAVWTALPWPWRSRFTRSTFPCDDCGLLTAPDDGPHEWYTVLDSIWEASGMGPEGILCIRCLEARLGRTLVKCDFMDAVLNRPGYGWQSELLLARLSS